MSKSVLVLEENLAIQGLIASSLPLGLLSLHQESDPETFLQQARALKPDLIFVSNEDCSRGYQTLRQIREDRELSSTPLVLLVNARDRLDQEVMVELGVEDQVRKPFEAENLRAQIRKHLLENLPNALDSDAEELSTSVEETPLFDEEMMSLISEAPGVAEDEAEVPEIDFASDFDEPPEGQDDDAELDDLSLSDLPELAAEAKALMQGLAPVAKPAYDNVQEAEEFGANDTFFEDLPESSQIMGKSPIPTLPKATEDSKGSRMTDKTSASANDEADLQLDEEISASDGAFQNDEDFILDEDLVLDDEVAASALAEPESELDALDRLKESGLEDQMARGQGTASAGVFVGSGSSWGDASMNGIEGSFFESNLEEMDEETENEGTTAAESDALEINLETVEDEAFEELVVSEEDLKEDEFVDLDFSGGRDVRGITDEIDSARAVILEEAKQLEETEEELETDATVLAEDVEFLEEAEVEIEAEKVALVEKAEVLEEVEEELETEKEMLIEKAVLLEKAEVELEAAKSVLSKEQAEVIEVELDAEETALAEEFELLGEAEAELKAEELELLDEAALLEKTEEGLQAEAAALLADAGQLQEEQEELQAQETALVEEAELLEEEAEEIMEIEGEVFAEDAEVLDKLEPSLETAEIADVEQNLDELDVYAAAPAAAESGGSGSGGSASGSSASAAEMDTVLLDLTPEDHANPPQDSRDQVILAETVEHVVAGPLTTTDDLDSFMEASSLEEMEADESLEEIGAEEVRLLADEEVVEGLGEEEMLDDDDLAELQSLDEEMAALEEQEVEALSGLEALEDEEDEVVPATFVETPDEDLATWKQAKERVREYAVETFQEVLDEEPPAAKESTDEAWEAAEEAAEVLEETAHQIADEISQEEQTFANWEEAEDEFMQHERYAESPELQPAGFGEENQTADTATVPKGDLEEIITRLVGESVEKTLQSNMPRGALEAAVESLVQRSVAQALDKAIPKIIEQIIQGVRDQSN
ncbi:MAG TPA: response regulator [Deltaproteobacteria bacterium]|nr:response regulator [Deltaproteobacteria bacterium]